MRPFFATLTCLLLVGCGPSPWRSGVSDDRLTDHRLAGYEDLASKYLGDAVRTRPDDRARPAQQPDPDIPLTATDDIKVSLDGPGWSKYQGHALIKLIKEKQLQEVGVSWGEWAHECFTDVQLDEFVRRDVPAELTKRLLNEKHFQEILLEIRDLPSAERDLLLQCARRTYKPTWAELGQISPAGQTSAGQRAERLIADEIADFVAERLSQTAP